MKSDPFTPGSHLPEFVGETDASYTLEVIAELAGTEVITRRSG
jgi:hypothetical protein